MKKLDVKLRYFLVKKPIIYKKSVMYKAMVIISEDLQEDDKFLNLVKFSTKDALNVDAHLLEISEMQLKTSEKIMPQDLWFEMGTSSQIRDYVAGLIKKDKK